MKKKIIKIVLVLLTLFIVIFGFYAYKLHVLAVEGNEIFEKRCTDVNPLLISYKNSFLEIASYLNDPQGNADINIEASFENYISGMRAYTKEEDKWLEMQKAHMNRWDFQLIEPWYIKEAAEYQWKMYEGYRDDTKYMLETFDAGGATEEISAKFTEARERRDKYEQMYYEFFDEAFEIRDWRKFFGYVPVPEGCTEENMTIPDTSGSIDWDGEEDPAPVPIDPNLVS